MSTKIYRYLVTVEYAGTVELDTENDGPFADDDDLHDHLTDLAIDEVFSGYFADRTVSDTEVTEVVERV